MSITKPNWLTERANWIIQSQKILKSKVSPKLLYSALDKYYSNNPFSKWDSKDFVSNYLGAIVSRAVDSKKAALVLPAAPALVPPAKTYLVGPISFSEHVLDEPFKHIYVIGEIHSLKPACKLPPGVVVVSTADLLTSAIRENPDKMIDLFIEHEHAIDQKGILISNQEDLMYQVLKPFKDCYTSTSKSKAKCPLRIHNVDIRRSENGGGINLLEGIFLESEKFLENAGVLNTVDAKMTLEGLKDLQSEIKEYVQLAKSDFVEAGGAGKFNHLNLIKSSKIAKQLNNFENQRFARVVLDYFLEKLDKEPVRSKDLDNLVGELNLILNDLSNKKIDRSHFKKSFQEINKLLHYLKYYVDFYTVARIFRTFGSGGGDSDSDSRRQELQYVFIYLGDLHAQNIRMFLEYVRLRTIHHLADKNGCIDISKVEVPLFPDI